jgi:hypothetical protein
VLDNYIGKRFESFVGEEDLAGENYYVGTSNRSYLDGSETKTEGKSKDGERKEEVETVSVRGG